jgi:hypothetical protein
MRPGGAYKVEIKGRGNRRDYGIRPNHSTGMADFASVMGGLISFDRWEHMKARDDIYIFSISAP